MRRQLRNYSQASIWCLIAILFSFAGGCAQLSLSGNREWSDLLSPFSSSEERREYRDNPLSKSEERKLCIETAEQLALRQHWTEAVQLYEKAESLGKPDQALDRELAPALAAIGRYPDAIDRYTRLLDKNPKDSDIQINLAWTLMESGNFAQAEGHLRQVIAREPKKQVAISNLAWLLVQTGKNEEAFHTFRSIMNDSVAHYNMGVLLLEAGQLEMARTSFVSATTFPDAPTQSYEFLKALSNPS